MNIVYTAIFFNVDEITSKYGQKHPNLFSHHSTIAFKPSSLDGLPIGEMVNVKVLGRLTTDRIDVLLVDNKISTNTYPHITLSTAEGVKPFESNMELASKIDQVIPLNDELIGVYGYFNGSTKIVR